MLIFKGTLTEKFFSSKKTYAYLLIFICPLFISHFIINISWEIIIICLTATLLLAISLIRPISLLYFWIAVAPLSITIKGFDIIPGIEQSLYGALNIFILPFLAILAFIHLRNVKEGLKFLSPFLILVFIPFAPGILSGNLELGHFRSSAGLLIVYLIGVLAYSYVNEKSDLLKLSLIAVVSSSFLCIYALVDFIFFREYSRFFWTTLRSASFVHINPNELSLFALVMGGISVANYSFVSDPIKKKIWLVIICFFFITILSTFSISGLGASIVFVSLLLLFKGSPNKLPIVIGMLFVLSIAMLIIIKTQIYELPQLYHLKTGGTWEIRSVIWREAGFLFLKNPFFGYSIEAGALLREHTPTSSAHNMLLAFLLRFGLIGTLGILWTFLRIIKMLYRLTFLPDKLLNNYGTSLLAIMVGIIVYGMAHSVGFGPHHFLIFWLLSLGTIGLFNQINKDFI